MNSQELKARIENIPIGDYEQNYIMYKNLIKDILSDMLCDENDLNRLSEHNQYLCTISRLKDKIASSTERIATLERQLKDAQAKCEEYYITRVHCTDVSIEVQQAERRGYELARSICEKCFSNDPCPTSVDDITYEQAIEEREGELK